MTRKFVVHDQSYLSHMKVYLSVLNSFAQLLEQVKDASKNCISNQNYSHVTFFVVLDFDLKTIFI